jgi:hypothetical protein
MEQLAYWADLLPRRDIANLDHEKISQSLED